MLSLPSTIITISMSSRNNIQELIERLDKVENSMKAHVTEQCTNLSEDLNASITANRSLIEEVKTTAQQSFDVANENSAKLVGLTSHVAELEKQKTTLVGEVNELKKTQATQAIQINVLQKRLEDQTCRNSRNSLIIRGVPEDNDEKTWDDTRRVLCSSLSRIVNVGEQDLSRMIERVHRGKKRNDNQHPRVIHARLFDWNDVETLKKRMLKNGKNSNIFVEQRFGPDTQYRQNEAKKLRKELKEKGAIGAGYVQYPARLMVKKDPRDRNEKYRLYQDFSNIPVPLHIHTHAELNDGDD